MMIDDNDD